MSAEEVAAAEAARQAALLSHADLVASARKDTGPLSIGGGARTTFVHAGASVRLARMHCLHGLNMGAPPAVHRVGAAHSAADAATA